MSDSNKSEHITRTVKFAVKQVETDSDRLLDEMLRSYKQELESSVRNEADTYEQRFIASLDVQSFNIAGISFDELYYNYKKYRKGEEIECDALFANNACVAILKVKQKLHLNDVLKVRDSLIGNFRKLCPEHRAKRLMVLVAGESINDDAVATALEAGFVVLSYTGNEWRMQNSQPMHY